MDSNRYLQQYDLNNDIVISLARYVYTHPNMKQDVVALYNGWADESGKRFGNVENVAIIIEYLRRFSICDRGKLKEALMRDRARGVA